MTTINKHMLAKWNWKTEWCKGRGFNPYIGHNWIQAEKAYNKHIAVLQEPDSSQPQVLPESIPLESLELDDPYSARIHKTQKKALKFLESSACSPCHQIIEIEVDV